MVKLTKTQTRLMEVLEDYEMHQASELQKALPDILSNSLAFHISILRKIVAPSLTISTTRLHGATHYQLTRVIR